MEAASTPEAAAPLYAQIADLRDYYGYLAADRLRRGYHLNSRPSPDEVALRNDQKRRLVECIQLLPIPQREAIVLCFEGFSYAEMAEILGITSNAVMLRCQRAKGTLRSIMERRS